MHDLHGHSRYDDRQADGTQELNPSSRVQALNDPALLCKYKSGKCSNRRATKRNGQLHTLCPFHRIRQNEHQRKSDRKHRMVSVVRRSRSGVLGKLTSAIDLRNRRDSISSISSAKTSDSDSAPPSPLKSSQSSLNFGVSSSRLEISQRSFALGTTLSTNPYEFQLSNHRQAEIVHTDTESITGRRGSMLEATPQPSPIHWRINLSRKAKEINEPILPTAGPISPSTPLNSQSSRLPPISFLTAAAKMDSFRSSSHTSMNLPPSIFIKRTSDLDGHVSKMA